MSHQNFGMRPGIILLREGTDTSQVRPTTFVFFSVWISCV
jgi:hypothetical protein